MEIVVRHRLMLTQRLGLCVDRFRPSGVMVASIAHPPDLLSFVNPDRLPTFRQLAIWNKKVAGAFRVQRRACHPDPITKSWILNQILAAILSNHRGVVIRFPINDGRNNN